MSPGRVRGCPVDRQGARGHLSPMQALSLPLPTTSGGLATRTPWLYPAGAGLGSTREVALGTRTPQSQTPTLYPSKPFIDGGSVLAGSF